MYIPDQFEPPASQNAGAFSQKSHNVSCESIEILDSKTIRIQEFNYNGKGVKTYFWAGVGPQPTNKGFKIPDENG